MNIKELRAQSPDELKSHLLELRKEQFNLRMQKGAGQLTQTHQVRQVRREIARTKMAIAESKSNQGTLS